jgi:hypothetical protein
VAGLLGPIAGGFFFDLTGDYRVALEFACVASILGLFNAMRLPEPASAKLDRRQAVYSGRLHRARRRHINNIRIRLAVEDDVGFDEVLDLNFPAAPEGIEARHRPIALNHLHPGAGVENDVGVLDRRIDDLAGEAVGTAVEDRPAFLLDLGIRTQSLIDGTGADIANTDRMPALGTDRGVPFVSLAPGNRRLVKTGCLRPGIADGMAQQDHD